jgi:hypothetical protein
VVCGCSEGWASSQVSGSLRQFAERYPTPFSTYAKTVLSPLWRFLYRKSSFSQDRLGTDIEKALKKRYVFSHAGERLDADDSHRATRPDHPLPTECTCVRRRRFMGGDCGGWRQQPHRYLCTLELQLISTDCRMIAQVFHSSGCLSGVIVQITVAIFSLLTR